MAEVPLTWDASRQLCPANLHIEIQSQCAQLRKRILIPGVNAKTHGLDVIIQIMCPDTNHILIPSGNGV